MNQMVESKEPESGSEKQDEEELDGIYSEHDSEVTESTISSVDKKANDTSILLPSIRMIHCQHCGTPNAEYLSNCDRCMESLVALESDTRITPKTCSRPTQSRPTKPPFSSKRSRKIKEK